VDTAISIIPKVVAPAPVCLLMMALVSMEAVLDEVLADYSWL